jgi:hypothetical protein
MKILAFGQFQHKKPEMHAISKIVGKLHVKTNSTAQITIASTDA